MNDYKEYNCRNGLEAGPHSWTHTASYTDFCFHCGDKLPCANPQQPTYFPDPTETAIHELIRMQKLNIPHTYTGSMEKEVINIPEPKKERKKRGVARPADVVFGEKMTRAYESYLGLMDKVKGLARHRALRYDGGDKLAEKLNRFVSRISEEIGNCKVSPGVIEDESAPLSEFLA